HDEARQNSLIKLTPTRHVRVVGSDHAESLLCVDHRSLGVVVQAEDAATVHRAQEDCKDLVRDAQDLVHEEHLALLHGACERTVNPTPGSAVRDKTTHETGDSHVAVTENGDNVGEPSLNHSGLT